MDTSAPEPAASTSEDRTTGLGVERSLPQRLLPTLPSWATAFTVVYICLLTHLCY